MKSQVEPNHYFKKNYDSKTRFISYWHQINEITEINPNTVLEIGIGNKFVSKYLKERNFNVTTLDIDERLKPDKVGSVLRIPYNENFFDVVACYELLEHLEYKYFQKALSEIHRVSKNYAILSLPDCSRVYRIFIQIPRLGVLKTFVPIPIWGKRKHSFDGEHYWEIEKLGYPLNRIREDITKVGFKIMKTYRIFEHPYHRFFVLEKNKK